MEDLLATFVEKLFRPLMHSKVFDVSPSDPGVLHPSPFAVFLSSQTSVPALRLLSRPDQIGSGQRATIWHLAEENQKVEQSPGPDERASNSIMNAAEAST